MKLCTIIERAGPGLTYNMCAGCGGERDEPIVVTVYVGSQRIDTADLATRLRLCRVCWIQFRIVVEEF